MAETVPYEVPMPEGLTDEDVIAALGRIPPNHSQVVMLADVENLSYKLTLRGKREKGVNFPA